MLWALQRSTGFAVSTTTTATTVTATTTVTRTPGQPSPPTKVEYLKDLQPSGGDVPMTGDTQVGAADFPDSIFYDNVGGDSASASAASACQNSPYNDCRATTYEIPSGHYHLFSAILGVTNTSPSSNQNAMAHWSVTEGSTVLKSGPFESNTQPQRIVISLIPGNTLQLLIGSDDPGLSEDVTFVWGNARLS